MYQIVSDGSCDLSQELIEKYQVHVVPFYITKDQQRHLKENVELGVEEFYQYMVENKNVFPKTSMPSVNDYISVFEPILKTGDDLICICITTKFSGSYNSASTAKQILEGDYPHQKITIIDATVNTVLQGLLVIEACHMRNQHFDYDKTVEIIETIKSTGRIFFTVGNFEYLIHGGRIGKVAGVAAQTLGIRPLIVLKEGEIFAKGVTRGREKSKRKVIELTIQHFVDHFIDPSHYAFCIGYGYDREEGENFKKKFEEAMVKRFPHFQEPILIQHIGATIGVHTGPYPIGVGVIEKYSSREI